MSDTKWDKLSSAFNKAYAKQDEALSEVRVKTVTRTVSVTAPEGSELFVMHKKDYDQLQSDRQILLEALQKCELWAGYAQKKLIEETIAKVKR